MILKCVAIDDEPLALDLISNYAGRVPSLKLINTFEDAISGAEYLRQKTVDLLFLDINMPDISGIDLARAIDIKPMIIFTTAHKQFAYEGFQLDAIDYLLKPINFEAFDKAVQKAIAFRNYQQKKNVSSEEACIYVHAEYRLVKILIRDIDYIESLEDYVRFHLGKDRTIMTLMTLKKALDLLPDEQFIRIHRSYIIPFGKIRSIQHRKVELESVILPIGDSYAEHLKRVFRNPP